jgi:hypothetical protein
MPYDIDPRDYDAIFDSGYRRGFQDGLKASGAKSARGVPLAPGQKRKRKLSAWQKFVKINSKKPRFRYKSGKNRGKINLKALGVAYRRTPAGRKGRR